MYSGAALYVLGAGAYATGYNVIGPMIFAAEDAKLNAAARAAAALENQGRPAPGAPCKTEAGGGGDKGRLPPGGVAEAGEEDEEPGRKPADERAKDIVAANGTKVTGYSRHGLNRAIGDAAQRAGTKATSTMDALKNPQSIKNGVDSLGRPFQTFTGRTARVVVNPQTGEIVSVNPIGGAGVR